MRKAFGKMVPSGNNPYVYAHFAKFLNQFHTRKNLQLENQGFNAILNTASQEKVQDEQALNLLNAMAKLVRKAKKKAYKDMLKSIYSEKIKDMMLKKMVDNF